jgi:ribosomal protein L5
MQVPRIEKITLNMGVGEAVADKKVMEHAVGDMECANSFAPDSWSSHAAASNLAAAD